MAKKNFKIAITSGDVDGIGPEVTAKALIKLGPLRSAHFYLWRSAQFPKKYLSLIDKKFKRKSVNSWAEAMRVQFHGAKELVDIVSPAPPPFWVEASAQAATYGHLDALVTAPLSKTLINESGLKDLGHTEILARESGAKNLFMSFLGESFHVVLATGHCPLAHVPQQLSDLKWLLATRAADHLAKSLKKRGSLALLGLNPHAGEGGLLGNEEKRLFAPLRSQLIKEKMVFDGPLVPDAAFLKKNWKKTSIYVATYHDQGLIPFKMIHDHKKSCQLTLGLPFVRTSVDHGTAKDIAGKNIADASSMVAALKWAHTLVDAHFKPDAFSQEDPFA